MSAVIGPGVVAALTTARLRDADEALSRKLDAATAQRGLGSGGAALSPSRFGITERRVLALVRAALDMIGGPDPVPLPAASPLAPGPSRYAVLGAAGFELPAYADMFSAFPAWRARVLRRGTEQPFQSLVDVPTAPFVQAVAVRALADAGVESVARARAEAFAMGLAGALAHEAVVAPVRRSAFGRRTGRPWDRRQPGAAVSADVDAALRRLVGGADPVARFRQWWPSAEEAAPLLGSYRNALEATYGLTARVVEGSDAIGVGGPALDDERVLAGYRRLLADQVPWSMGDWFGVLTPILLAPAVTLALGGALLPGMRSFLAPTAVTERSFSELITLADGLNSITPFVASMVMWANVPDQPAEPFISALWTFLARVGLTAGWLPTIGTPAEDPSPGARWGLAGASLGLDVYQLFRLLVARGARQPGPAVVFGVQNITAVMTATTVLQAGLAKGAVSLAKEAGADDTAASVAGWVTMGVTALGLWLGLGLPLAKALSTGGGWMSWFVSDDVPSLRGSLGPAGDSMDAAALFDDSALWADPAVAAPGLTDLRYPTGLRPLVKVWRESGSPERSIAAAGHTITLRQGATDTPIVIGPGARTVADVVAALAAVPGVHAAAVGTGPDYDLPWPVTFAEPGADADPRPLAGGAAATTFTPLPDDEEHAYLLRHVPDDALAARLGAAGSGRSPFDGLRGVPGSGLADLDDTALGTAADLALLLGLGLASRTRTITPLTPAPDPLLVPAPPPAVATPLRPVDQVFRRWNLDHRRVNEWRTIVAGGAAPEAPFPADNALADGAAVAHAMGWVGLWRAWLRVAADTTEDTAAPVPSRDTPFVRTADGRRFRPTNAQLTNAMRYLLDLDP